MLANLLYACSVVSWAKYKYLAMLDFPCCLGDMVQNVAQAKT